jgi:RNA polymerase sigma-70 factor (ECF subfamily)
VHERQTQPSGSAPAPSPGAAAAAAGAEVDVRLIEGMRAGDARGLAGLYDRHAPAMLGVATRILRDRGDAEDLVHDVFIEAWHKAASFSLERGGVRTWLLVRVRSRAIDRLRSLEVARRHARHAEAPAVARPARGVDDAASAPDRLRARTALAALPEAQRMVVELAYYEGLSCSEIATRCGIPLGTAKSRLVSGMRELRRRFDAPEVRHGAG